MVFMKTLLFYYNVQKYTENKTALLINKDRPPQKHDVCSMKYGRKV